MEPSAEEDITSQNISAARGLGIDVNSDSPASTAQPQTIKRTPVGSKTGSNQNTPDSRKSAFSPASSAALSGSTRFTETFDDVDVSYGAAQPYGKQSSYSLNSINAPSVSQNSETSLLRKSATTSIREQYDDFNAPHRCSSAKHFKRPMNNWLAIMIVVLSLFSTFFSGAFLIIALRGPRYDMIGKEGTLTISSAAFLTSFFAKMIELSFVTVVVAFIGQSLSRRAFNKRETQTGVTLAEISMRSWITQPGTMFTHWQSVRYAVTTWLGAIALIAAIMALLYTSAATALVQPQLKFSGWERRGLQGPVMASFANSPYLEKICKTPITYLLDAGDDETTQQTCISNEHAAQAFHNYFHWIGVWTDVAFSGNGTQELATRPEGWALLNDNVTITAPWIDQQPPVLHEPEGWFINNVTMAMPHPGVVLAAVDPANQIPQPEELNGLGIYSIRASVPSPFVNVLCAMGMSSDQLKPLIWETWDDANKFDASNWPAQLDYGDRDLYLNSTPFDDIFLWGEDYGNFRWPPVFPILPTDYNTIINDTIGVPLWGRTAVYVLAKGGDVDAIGTPTEDNYALCQLQVGQTPDCSTRYNASSNVGTLEALCEDPEDDMRYIKSLTNATTGRPSLSADWPNIAQMWARALELNGGYFDSNGTNSRMLSEFILTNASRDWSVDGNPPVLALNLPSPAEALAVMSGCTLIQSAQDAPFVEFWNYSSSYLDEPQIQWFNASIRAQAYASGGMWGYQKAFFIVLFAVFALNVFILVSWIIHREWFVNREELHKCIPNMLTCCTLYLGTATSQNLQTCSVWQSTARHRRSWRIVAAER